MCSSQERHGAGDPVALDALIVGLVSAAGLKVGSVLQRAAAEEELLEIGAQFSQALLKDPRFPNPRRHLRRRQGRRDRRLQPDHLMRLA